MARKNSSSSRKELMELITNYEAAKAENRQIYMDGDQLADIADWYATELKYTEAQEAITYGLNLHPQSTDLLMEQAYLYLDTRQLQKAKQAAAVINEDYSAEVKMLKAELLLNEGKLEEADQLLETLENDADLLTITDIVYLFLDLGYPDSAEKWLQKGAPQYADETDFQALKADYLFAIHQLEDAIYAYNQLIDKAPYNASYWMGLAKCYFIQDKMDKAIEACDFALAANEHYGEAYSYRAHCFFYLNNPDEAIANYEKAITYKAIPPEMAYMFIGISYANKEEWQKAIDYYTRVIECFEKAGDGESILLIDTYTSKAFALCSLRRFEEAHQLCEKARKINPNEGIVYLTDGKLFLAEGKEEEAEAAFQKALELIPGVETIYTIAAVYSENNYRDKAREYYKTVYDLDPNYETITEKMSIISLMDNKIEDFFKYNSECKYPLDQEIITDMLTNPRCIGIDKLTLKEVLNRMEKENKKNEK